MEADTDRWGLATALGSGRSQGFKICGLAIAGTRSDRGGAGRSGGAGSRSGAVDARRSPPG